MLIMNKRKEMRVISIIAIILLAAMCLWATSCTTPEPKKADASTQAQNTPPTPTPPATTGSTGQTESVAGGESTVGVKNPPAIMALFKEKCKMAAGFHHRR